MANTYPAFDISPVPTPAPDAEAPELFHGLYGMPMFVTLPTADLAASVDFWTRGLGFFDLFTVPNQITHLRRWAFQDVLLVPGERPAAAAAQTVSFSCVLSQIDQIAADCERLTPGCTTGPRRMPWNSIELEVRTPENVRVIMTAAHPYDATGPEAEFLRSIGIATDGR
ncbi:VOC family protein [Nocardia sp. NBC_01503]|uniref:VOC family protein n=1 Tax=Nocardia sp. NBC_01503 TaxID=2975997 RepID=UPI002E7B4BEA|nr:VOC family protein [Nocardia sp. NBC_01503]WTL31193.1 VOC family protein [Nocardia sp. NBC_01503]